MKKEKKIILIIVIGIIIVLSIIVSFCKDSNTLENNTVENQVINEETIEENNEFNAIFGDEEGKTNYYLKNEKIIRKFVTEYNATALKKVSKVDWTKNHQIATLNFDDLDGKINTSGDVGFLIEFEFDNGKSKLNDYKILIKEIFKVIDKSYDDELFEIAFDEALKNEYKTTSINDNASITIHYNEEPVGYLKGDIYFIDISLKNYE